MFGLEDNHNHIKFDHGGSDSAEELEAGPFEVDVEHDSAVCDGRETVKMVASITAPPHRSGRGYRLFPGVGYYKLHAEAKKWDDARRACTEEGAHLAIVNSEEESKALQKLLESEAKTSFALIGFHDLFTEGAFVTIFGQPLKESGFYRWSSTKEPNNLGQEPGEDCGSIHKNGGLNDFNCNAPLPFICELPQ
uniref:C-type lectin domain-containing protein n=2 Tax=Timema TaxID=61471 RepID=A0A7R9FE13_9NEOP|nr:unnamed protein product [Timema bartmani]CAD7451837.1 unnamed protein product [Timema tahoe]